MQELQIISVLRNDTRDVPVHVTRQNLSVRQLIRIHHTHKHVKETVHISMNITNHNTSVWLSMFCMRATNQTSQKDNWYMMHFIYQNTLTRQSMHLCMSHTKTRHSDSCYIYAYHTWDSNEDSWYLCTPLTNHFSDAADTIMHVVHQTDQWYSWYIYAFYTEARFQENVYLLSYHAIITVPKYSPKHKI